MIEVMLSICGGFPDRRLIFGCLSEALGLIGPCLSG